MARASWNPDMNAAWLPAATAACTSADPCPLPAESPSEDAERIDR